MTPFEFWDQPDIVKKQEYSGSRWRRNHDVSFVLFDTIGCRSVTDRQTDIAVPALA